MLVGRKPTVLGTAGTTRGTKRPTFHGKQEVSGGNRQIGLRPDRGIAESAHHLSDEEHEPSGLGEREPVESATPLPGERESGSAPHPTDLDWSSKTGT